MKSGKIWGETHLVFSNCNSEVQYMKCNAGKQCSKHCHEHKYNMFYVFSGQLEIHVWKNDYDLCDVTILRSGERTVVKPGEYHRFVVLQDAEVLEVYWVELKLSDIDRKTCGGSVKYKLPAEELAEHEEKEIFRTMNNENREPEPVCPPNETIKEYDINNEKPKV